MLSASTSLIAATAALSNQPSAKVTADFNRTGTQVDISQYVTSVSAQRDLNGDLPSEVRLAVGYGSASSTIDLDNTNLTWIPTNTASPFYGKKRVETAVSVQLGFGGEFLKRFTGYIRALASSGSNGTASIEALDPSDRLRTEVALPMVNSTSHPGLTGRYFIDYILTANGITPASQDMESSLNNLTTTPYVDGKQDAWTLIQTIASAELATVFFDTTGKFHFWNRNHFIRQSVNYTNHTVTANGITNTIPEITSQTSLQDLSFSESVDSVKNIIDVPFTAYEIQPADWVWQTNDPLRLLGKQTRTVYADLDDPSLQIQTSITWIGRDFVTAGNSSGYRACRNKTGTGLPVANIQFTVTVTAQRVKIVMYNPNPFDAYLVSPTKIPSADPVGTTGGNYDPAIVGSPMLWIKGRAVTERSSPTSTTSGGSDSSMRATAGTNTGSSIDLHGEQQLTFDNQGWIQDSDTAQQIADWLLEQIVHPIPTIGDVLVFADPRLELGDRIKLKDPITGMTLDEDCWIVGIRDDWSSDNGYTQTLTLRLCAALGGWVLGHPTRSSLGVTTILGGIY